MLLERSSKKNTRAQLKLVHFHLAKADKRFSMRSTIIRIAKETKITSDSNKICGFIFQLVFSMNFASFRLHNITSHVLVYGLHENDKLEAKL